MCEQVVPFMCRQISSTMSRGLQPEDRYFQCGEDCMTLCDSCTWNKTNMDALDVGDLLN